MNDAVIVAAVRTPVAKKNGALSSVHPADLSAHVLEHLVERTGIDPVIVDDVVWGCVSQVGEQTFDIARTAALSAGWPESVPGTTVDRQCGSSQQAVHFTAAGLISGQYDIAVAGGVESMSRIPMGSAQMSSSPFGARYVQRYGPEAPDQGIGAEMIAEQWGLSRQRLDEFALVSHERASLATDAGLFTSEIAPVEVDGTFVSHDEGIRRGGTLESLSRLRPAFCENGTVTAANASQISDGASALLMTTSETAARLGLSPIARVHTAVVVGSAPMPMLTGPIPATSKALSKSGLRIDDIGVFEVNEAFASVTLAWASEFNVDLAKVNPRGGAIAIGHPLGGSGTRLMTSMLHHMRAENIRYGLQTMCEGGGQANATILELL
ncbi:acetyl-CoA acyltransferase (plasmid) [Rhodococcus qingshengii]|uniref:thiolase family protein n=1 Tax=Rhodococcus qingshengii TaxID=334542 RepID=UPI0007E575B6|nr:thiolase family protein [Rhodococcus qingshengii]BCF86363.1 acetyl-CoA acyltransferase [Rhodococcus qingshengii]